MVRQEHPQVRVPGRGSPLPLERDHTWFRLPTLAAPRLAEVVLVAGTVVLFGLVGAFLPSLAASGREKTVVLLCLLPLVYFVPTLVERSTASTVIALPLLLIAVPAPFILAAFPGFYGLSLLEVSWGAAALILLLKAGASGHGVALARLRRVPWAFLALYFLGACVSFVIGTHAIEDLGGLRTLTVFPLVILVVLALAINKPDDAYRALTLLAAGAGVLALVFVLRNNLGPWVQSGTYGAFQGRASLVISVPYLGSLTINPASAGDKFAFLALVGWFLQFFGLTRVQRVLGWIAWGLGVAVVITAEGRGGLATIVVGMAVLSLWGLKSSSVRSLRLVVTAVGGAALLAGAMWWALISNWSPLFRERILGALSDPSSDANLVGRFPIWRVGIQELVSHPAGIGFSGFVWPQAPTWGVHNFWLFVGLSFGWLGLMGLLLTGVWLFRKFLFSARSEEMPVQNLGILGICALVCVAVAGQFSALLWEPYSVAIVWALLGICLAGGGSADDTRTRASGSFRWRSVSEPAPSKR